MSTEKQDNKIRLGGLWPKENEYGKFYSGKLSKKALEDARVDDNGDIQITIFKVKEKKTENSPGFNVFAFRPDGGKPKPVTKPGAKSAKAPQQAVEPEEPDDVI